MSRQPGDGDRITDTPGTCESMTSNERRIIPGWKNDPRRKPAARTAVRSQRLSSPIYPVVVRVVRASLKARLAKRIGTSVPHAMRPVGKAGVFAVSVRVMVGCLVAVYNFRFCPSIQNTRRQTPVSNSSTSQPSRKRNNTRNVDFGAVSSNFQRRLRCFSFSATGIAV